MLASGATAAPAAVEALGLGNLAGVGVSIRPGPAGAVQINRVRPPAPPPPPPRTKWTRRVPHPVLIGHAASLTPY